MVSDGFLRVQYVLLTVVGGFYWEALLQEPVNFKIDMTTATVKRTGSIYRSPPSVRGGNRSESKSRVERGLGLDVLKGVVVDGARREGGEVVLSVDGDGSINNANNPSSSIGCWERKEMLLDVWVHGVAPELTSC